MGKKLLLANDHVPGIQSYEVYRKYGGYASVEKALKTMTADAVVEEVRAFQPE
jgi:NADH-quinone oxidoreductase subunit F